MGRQLVGQRCVRCRERIGSDLGARFCPACGLAGHTNPCPEATPAAPDQRCPTCGGDRSVHLPPDYTGGPRALAAPAAGGGALVPSGGAQLVGCSACGRQISTAAVACPQCGHPAPGAAPAGPQCYCCPAAATTRCQRCGALSCAVHVRSTYVPHGRGGAHELRCRKCYESAQLWKLILWVWAAAVIIGVFAFMLGR